jgi:hypothetical protein
MKFDSQLFFLAVSSIVVVVLGTFGFYEQRAEKDLLTSIYLALQLFSMNSGVVEGVTPLSIEISRWLALGTLIAVVYATINVLLVHFRSSVRIAFLKNHAIVCGAGKRDRLQCPRSSSRRRCGVLSVRTVAVYGGRCHASCRVAPRPCRSHDRWGWFWGDGVRVADPRAAADQLPPDCGL